MLLPARVKVSNPPLSGDLISVGISVFGFDLFSDLSTQQTKLNPSNKTVYFIGIGLDSAKIIRLVDNSDSCLGHMRPFACNLNASDSRNIPKNGFSASPVGS